MKKTIWQPVALGSLLGLLAGITLAANLTYILSIDINNTMAIGFYMTFLLIAAALGGPLAGVIASILLVVLGMLFGPPGMREILRMPVYFWTNVISVGIPIVLAGFAYRMIFKRVKMPVRLLLWAGIVIAVYLLKNPIQISIQYWITEEVGILKAILYAYRVQTLQVLFDILITSLVFIALPSRYTHPLWFEGQPVPPTHAV